MGYIGRVNFDLNVICIGDIIIVEIWWVYEGCFLESEKFIVLDFGKGGVLFLEWYFIWIG